MILFNKNSTLVKHLLNTVFNNIKKIKPMGWIFLILLLVALVLYYRIFTKGEMTFEEEMLHNSKYVEAPIMNIDIKFKNYQNLLYQRNNALAFRGEKSFFYYGEKFEKVPAKITYEGHTYKAKIRLKGSRKVHFRDSTRMSLRVSLNGEKTILGMKTFSLQDPKMRNYIYEWLFHDLLRKEGIIAINYKFIHLYVNGIDRGIFAIEEHFEKRLIERYGYKDGPIFKLTDDGDGAFERSTEPFKKKKYMNEPFVKTTNKAQDLLLGLLDKKYKVSEVINSQKLGKYYAICDFFNIYHGGLVKSIRLYYNPITMKFEPIGFDGHFDVTASHFINGSLPQNLGPFSNIIDMILKFHEVLFSDKRTSDELFWTEYIKALKEFSSIKYVDKYFSDIAEPLTHNLAIIYQNSPLETDLFNAYKTNQEFKFSKRFIIMQAKYIRELLYLKIRRYYNFFDGYIDGSVLNKNELRLKFSNNYQLPLKLSSIVINDSLKFFPQKDYFILPSRYKFIRDYSDYKFVSNLILPLKIDSSYLEFYIPGIDSILTIDVPVVTDKVVKHKNDIVRKPIDFVNYEKYFIINEKEKEITFKSGKLIITKPLILKKDYKVIITNETELVFQDSAFLFSYSQILIQGTEKKPVKITSDYTGGIIVLNSRDTSQIENVIFENLSSPRLNEWKLTGSVTFYESPVIMKNVAFKNNISEDALNVIRSNFSLDSVNFENTSSDAFDADFSNGTITNTKFVNCGNDGIDVSGSEITGKNLEIINAEDKAISAGERSSLEFENLKILDSEIGVTSKDKSVVKIDGIFIKNTKLGYTSFQKKSEYGSAEINVVKSIMEKVRKEFLIEKGSVLKLNGKKIDGTLEKVSDILYGNEYGKKSIR
ncbi:MAG: CotH kinase family protein [Candidatus Delongbacteria bacterium]|jgi:hypothetical protein|nr:CotH kinase family protein [Candidatus Delongbacteria bacterium]